MTDQMRAKAVILGGTGHIGSAIARRFDTAGYDVVAVGNRDIDRPNLAGTTVRVVLGNDTNATQLAAWFENAATVVDCATPYPVWMFNGADRDAPRAAVARIQTILNEVRKAGAGFTLISSFTTLARQEGIFASIRRGALHGAHPYFELKKQVEAEAQAYLDQGHPGAIIAPGTCFGPYDLKPREQTFIPMLLGGQVPVISAQEMNVIDVRDVADVVFAARHGRFSSPVPAFGHNVNLKDLVAQTCAIGGVPAPKVSMPAALGAAGLYWMETAYAVAGKQTPWPSLSILLLAASYAAAPDRTQQQLHPTLRPLGNTLRDAVDWYRNIGSI